MPAHDNERLRRVVRQDARFCAILEVPYIPVAIACPPAPQPEVHVVPRPANAATARTPAAPMTPSGGPDEAQRQLDDLRARYEAEAPHQHFVTNFKNIVFGEGDPCARLMFIGEAPGAEEDRTGRPFVGRAGELLEKMIVAMGLARDTVYITNVLKTRPPNNATPTGEEAQACAPFLYDQIRIIRPEVIVTLGLPATRLILQTNESMGRMRGRWGEVDLGDSRVPVMPTYHPAFVLRSYTPENRQRVWSDLQMAMQRLGLAVGA